MTPEAVMPALKARGLYPKILRALGVSRQALDSWRVVPADRVLAIAGISGFTPHTIRPDVFPNHAGNTAPLNGRRTNGGQRRLEAIEARRRAARLRKRKQQRSKANGKGRRERPHSRGSAASLR